MKVLYSCLSKSWGGLEMFTLTSIQQLLKRNISVELLCSEDSRIHIEANNMGIMLHPVKANGYFHPITTFKTSLLIRNNTYSLVHTQASKDLWLLVPALFLANSQAPIFLTKQVGSSIIKRDFLHNQLYKRISKIFAISTAIKNNVLQTTPVEKQDVIIMPNGIDIKKFNPDTIDSKKIRSEYNISQDEIVIGMLARFTPGKGHEELLWAAKELNKEFNKLRYIIVGEPSRGESDYAEKIKGLANDYKLDNVLFTGFRSDVPEVLAALDIFAFPSHSEAFGIALVEAMAMKKPSVCSNAEGILDIAINDSTSYLFENKNAEDLKNKLKLLINSSETRLKFGENSRKRVLNNFDIELLNDKMVKIYSEAIGEIEEQ